MSATGQTQGAMTNDCCTIKQRKDTCLIIAYEHEVISPRDAATGLSTGKRQHKPFRITKEIDRSTPMFFSALTRNEIMTEVLFQHFYTTKEGVETLLYTVKLINANLSGIRSWMHNTKDESTKALGYLEEISFTYERIEWSHEVGSTSAVDDWTER
jgi:type VI secretion system secreted protein Hcp